MNKALAEIIAGLIPHKMTRNRWRGILRYGIFNALKLKTEIRQNIEAPKYNLAVCAIAKDEGPYFKEWIEWHRKAGVEKFYIYDNGSTDETREALDPYIQSGVVEYKYFPGHRKQLAAYDDCLECHRMESRWLAFIDIDEFIVPLKDATISDFLRKFEEYPVVEINWLIYGSNGMEKKSPAPVMQRFTRHSRPDHKLNRHVKSIVNPRRVYNMVGCHEACRISGKGADSHGVKITRNFREREPQQDVIRINHYAVKSREEFMEKQLRGRASGKKRTVPDAYFSEYDLNDIPDSAPVNQSVTEL